ncbi:MAG: nicotinate phosphoribosyltransferase, partial [Pseudomonadota bacterium]|nr:nicotinate phosphoribosyltransferase [Pseudomonadota bacterium]
MSKTPPFPPESGISRWTDAYFRRTRQIVEKFGDATVTYAVFMRRPVVSAPR